jgi:hypothetical protein
VLDFIGVKPLYLDFVLGWVVGFYGVVLHIREYTWGLYTSQIEKREMCVNYI